jgi:hypothetical protein
MLEYKVNSQRYKTSTLIEVLNIWYLSLNIFLTLANTCEQFDIPKEMKTKTKTDKICSEWD